MPRLPHLLLLLLCALLLCAVGAGPALAVPPPAAVATADEWADEDPGDGWATEDPGDDWADDECFEDCDDDGMCIVAGEWSDDEVASDDDEWGDDWSDEDPGDDWDAEACEEDEDEWSDDEGDDAAPVRLSGLHATPARRSVVHVRFRLDRGSRVTLTLRRTGGARASGRSRAAAVRGTVSVTGRKGANATTLRKWHGRALKPGRYRLTATPAAGRGATTAFTLKIAARRG